MSRNGDLCLRKVIITYCPSRGSPNTRQFLSTHLPLLSTTYPSVHFDLRPRLWAESSVTGLYRDGSERAYHTRGLSPLAIALRLHRLAAAANDGDEPFAAAHVHFQRRSVQGAWAPWLWHAEAARRRSAAPPWDRRLTEEEWRFFTEQYGAQARQEEEAVGEKISAETELPEENTREAQERWRRFVVPRLQTDGEFNVAHFKRQHARGVAQEPVREGEYRLFSAPDHREMGQDAVDLMRRREAKTVEDWWRQRREQLKPPK